MKFSKLSLIIIIVVVLVAIAGLIFRSGVNQKSVSKTTTSIPSPTSVVISPGQAPKVSSTAAPAKPFGYSAAFKAKARSDFISGCNAKSNSGIPVCTCAAVYLAKNYSEAQLTEIYIQAKALNQVPGELKTALRNCSAK